MARKKVEKRTATPPPVRHNNHDGPVLTPPPSPDATTPTEVPQPSTAVALPLAFPLDHSPPQSTPPPPILPPRTTPPNRLVCITSTILKGVPGNGNPWHLLYPEQNRNREMAGPSPPLRNVKASFPLLEPCQIPAHLCLTHTVQRSRNRTPPLPMHR